MTYADIAFIPFQLFVPNLMVEELKPYDLEQFKEAAGWMERMIGRPAVKKVVELRLEQ
jgi:glutathione S-transferase